MLSENSIITAAPAPTAPPLSNAELIEKAQEETRRAARIAASFENLSQSDFEDLDSIARLCNSANRTLDQLKARLAEREVSR